MWFPKLVTTNSVVGSYNFLTIAVATPFLNCCLINAGRSVLGEVEMNIKDESGYVIFSDGEVGSAHVMAHRLLDAGDIALGRDRLGQWLVGREGSGSDWAHIQFYPNYMLSEIKRESVLV